MLDLTTFLESARRSGPERYLEINEAHDIKLEACALIARLEQQQRAPLVLFTELNTLAGGRSPFPLLINTFASREACALALGLPKEKSGVDLVLDDLVRDPVTPSVVIDPIGRPDVVRLLHDVAVAVDHP